MRAVISVRNGALTLITKPKRQNNERRVINDEFNQLAKGLAQAVMRIEHDGRGTKPAATVATCSRGGP